jgi:hypothetical protein
MRTEAHRRCGRMHSIDVSDVVRASERIPERGPDLPVSVPSVVRILQRIVHRFDDEPLPSGDQPLVRISRCQWPVRVGRGVLDLDSSDDPRRKPTCRRPRREASLAAACAADLRRPDRSVLGGRTRAASSSVGRAESRWAPPRSEAGARMRAPRHRDHSFHAIVISHSTAS